MKKGDKYNHLTAIRFIKKDKKYKSFWLFRCDCGNEKIINTDTVKHGRTKSCGCLQKEFIGRLNKSHYMCNTPEYCSWANMKNRCGNVKSDDYKDYGKRGITVCKRWMKFENFYEDMGNRLKGTSLDRINNNGNYEPNNCRWATPKQQQNNKQNSHFLVYNGKNQTLAQWAREIGVKYKTMWMRTTRNWSVEKVLTK